MACPRMAGCPMFAVFTLKSSLRVWQARYCEAAYDDCIRYRLFRSGTCAPPSLLPNGKRLDTREQEASPKATPPATPVR